MVEIFQEAFRKEKITGIMKILQICNKSPYPPKEGGSIAMNSITQGLIKKGHSVKIFAVSTPKCSIDTNKIPQEYKDKTEFESVFIDTSVRFLDAFFNLFSKTSYNISRFISKDFDNRLAEILQKTSYDIIQLESLYVTPYIDTIRKHSKAKIILRSHNVEHLIWNRIAANCRNPLKRLYLRHLAYKLKKYEISMFNRYDGIASISETDIKTFKELGCNIPLKTITFGIEINKYPIAVNTNQTPSLFHIGSMNWMPNEEGIRWFLDVVWNDIHKRHPELKLHLAGIGMPQWLTGSSYPNVEVHGEVKNTMDFMNSHSIMIVPLLSGSGIRVKIIEGMALGKAIITTTIGAEGINCKDSENILIADTPSDFCEAVAKCIQDRNFCTRLGINARKLIEQQYNIDMIVNDLIEFYNL